MQLTPDLEQLDATTFDYKGRRIGLVAGSFNVADIPALIALIEDVVAEADAPRLPTPVPAPEDTPLTSEDNERLWRQQGVTPAQIAAAKKARGTPLP